MGILEEKLDGIYQVMKDIIKEDVPSVVYSRKEEPLLDLSSPVQTKTSMGSKPSEVAFFRDKNTPLGFPHAGIIENVGSRMYWSDNGALYDPEDIHAGAFDLVNIPPKSKNWWVNVRVNTVNEYVLSVYKSREEADKYAVIARISCVEITTEMIEDGRANIVK